MAGTLTVGTDKMHANNFNANAAAPPDFFEQGLWTIETYITALGKYQEYIDMRGKTNKSAVDYLQMVAQVPNQGKRATGIIIEAPTASGVTSYAILPGLYDRVYGYGITISGTHDWYIRAIILTAGAANANTYNYIVGNVIYDLISSNREVDGIYINDRRSNYVYNNLLMNFHQTGGVAWACRGIFGLDSESSLFKYNTVMNMETDNGPLGDGISTSGVGSITTYNSIVVYCDLKDFRLTSPPQYSASQDLTANGVGCINNQDPEDDLKLAVTTAGSEDATLLEGSSAIGIAQPDVTITTDIAGNPRDPINPDAGCFEYTPPVDDNRAPIATVGPSLHTKEATIGPVGGSASIYAKQLTKEAA